MKTLKNLIWIMVVSIFIVTCRSAKDAQQSKVPEARIIHPVNTSSYHNPINLTIAWYPYKNMELVQSGDNQWTVKESTRSLDGAVPVILVTYPMTGDTVWLEMNTDNETLGRLVKHGLMTQEPIYEPIGEYLRVNTCDKCHPASVDKGY